MKILAVHDANGDIHEIVISPTEGPAMSVTPSGPGLLVAEVESTEFEDFDLADPKGKRQFLSKAISSFRVEGKSGLARKVAK